MEYSTMQILWYLVVCAAVVMYTILDGFDLGVGSLHLFAKNDKDRRIFLNAIGPIWDGNEVWLIIIGGALFSGFPVVYSTIFSSFYTLLMIFLAGIIFRAVAIEFRSKHDSTRWRNTWDILFSLSSVIIAWGAGVVLGNLILGLPIDGDMVYRGTFWNFLNPYAILIGFLGLSIFTLHGAIFLLMKTEKKLHKTIRGWIKPLLIFFLVFLVIVTIHTAIVCPHMMQAFKDYPLFSIIPVFLLLSIINIPWQIIRHNDGYAFISSSITIFLLYTLFGIGTFPNMVRSTLSPDYTLTLYNASSAPTTLAVILVIAAIGVPLVLAYGYFIYSIFRGKVIIDDLSY